MLLQICLLNMSVGICVAAVAALRIAAASVTIQPLQKSAGGSIAPEPGDVTFLFCLIYCFASNGSCEL
jgi:hypothetical protein